MIPNLGQYLLCHPGQSGGPYQGNTSQGDKPALVLAANLKRTMVLASFASAPPVPLVPANQVVKTRKSHWVGDKSQRIC